MAITSPIAAIDASGISAPVFADILQWVQEQFQAIYGNDIDIDADTQDGQWIAIIAQVLSDANQTIVAAYNSYSPSYAIGAGLSSVVKINGIRRHIPTYGTVLLDCIGIAGTDISGGIVGSNLNQQVRWQLPTQVGSVVIPSGGEVFATATCLTLGANRASVGELTRIVTPIVGWQTVTNPTEASPGLPVESDAQLRRRQTQSVANPSQTVVLGIQGAIESLPDVLRVMVYENPTNAPDQNGIPAYSMAAIVEGGDAQQIANAIALRKTPGSPTYGTTSIIVYDARGIPSRINFFQLTLVPITVNITLKALAGFTQSILQEMITQVINYLVAIPIGYDSYYTKLVAATQLSEPDGLTYDVTWVAQSRDGNTPAAADVIISYIEAAYCDNTMVTVTVT